MALTSKYTDEDLIAYVQACKDEAESAREVRDAFTENNYDTYHLRHDFSHKVEGQSTEVLSKLRMAVESTKSFVQQSLADISEWFTIDRRNTSVDEAALLIKPAEAKKLLEYELTKSKYFAHVGLSVQRALLGGVMISKTTGKLVPQPKFVIKSEGKGKNKAKYVEKVEDKTWELAFSRVRNQDFYPDPSGTGLYQIEDMWQDLHTVRAQSEGPDAIYSKTIVNQLSTGFNEEVLHQADVNRETGQDQAIKVNAHRPKVKLTEYWGTIIDCEGNILHENCVMTIANDMYVIRPPELNPLWHQGSPYTTTALLDVDESVWPIALCDAGAMHNNTLDEMFNLILDAAFKQVHAPAQIRTQDLANPEQVADGIPPGIALKVKSSLPPGAKVMEPLSTVEIPGDALNVMNLLQQEFNSSMLTTDLRQGVLPNRAVKATEVVESSQTITSIFQGITKNIEQGQIVVELEKAWSGIAQNLDLISKDELVSLFGIERGLEISKLDPEDVFVQTVSGYKFAVFGITQTLAKAQDFRKLTTLLQTISSSDMLIEEFVKKYDMGKLLGEIMGSLGIEKAKIELPQQPEQAPAGPMPSETPAMPGANGDMASVPSAPPQGDILSQLMGPASGGPTAGVN